MGGGIDRVEVPVVGFLIEERAPGPQARLSCRQIGGRKGMGRAAIRIDHPHARLRALGGGERNCFTVGGPYRSDVEGIEKRQLPGAFSPLADTV